MDKSEEVVIMLRRIIRATDLRSKKLAKESGLSSPQFMVLNAIFDLGNVAISRVAKEVNLTQATVTTIIDKLENKGLVQRIRSETDKRVVHATLTQEGRKRLDQTPQTLQDQFLEKYNMLEDWEQNFLLSGLQRIVGMMEAEKLDASPFLHLGDIDYEAEHGNSDELNK